MTAPRRGRGRPALFTAQARDRYLVARRTGDSQEKAAAAAGVAARTVRDVRRTDPDFRALDDAAAAEGRRARMPHGESRYVNLGCRCGICTKDASAKRAGRREGGTAACTRYFLPVSIGHPRRGFSRWDELHI